MKLMKLGFRGGMSLLEILIVIALLMILVTGSFMLAPTQIRKALDAKRKSDLHKLKINLEMYYDFADQFPDELPNCGEPLKYGEQVIMASVPCDPVTGEPYAYQTRTKTETNNNQSYRIYTMLENTEDISIADVGCLGGCGLGCSYNYGVSSLNADLVKCSYVCAPGGGKTGYCEMYQDPSISLCPKLYYMDSTCNNECGVAKNRCQNASGKNVNF